MSNTLCYDINDVKKQLTHKLDKTVSLRKAWEGVTFKTKKDGTPFKRISQAIEGATIRVNVLENGIVVCVHNNAVYFSDTLCAWEELKTNDLETIKKRIADRIDYYKDVEKKTSANLANLERIYADFSQAIKDAYIKLSDACGGHTALYYLLDEMARYYKFRDR